MAYPTSTDLKTLDYTSSAQPFVQILGTSAATIGLDLPFGAQPFNSTDLTTVLTSNHLMMLLGVGS